MKPGDRFTKNGVTVEAFIPIECLLISNGKACINCCLSINNSGIQDFCDVLLLLMFGHILNVDCGVNSCLAFKLIEGDLNELIRNGQD